MAYIISFLALVGLAYIWALRIRHAAAVAREMGGMASDVIAAARRFGFRRKHNLHPVESLDDPILAVAGCGLAFLELNGLPSAEQHETLDQSLRAEFHLNVERAQEALILGRWLISESGGANTGFTRLLRRLFKLQGANALSPLMRVLDDVAKASTTGLSGKQKDALDEVKQIFRLR